MRSLVRNSKKNIPFWGKMQQRRFMYISVVSLSADGSNGIANGHTSYSHVKFEAEVSNENK